MSREFILTDAKIKQVCKIVSTDLLGTKHYCMKAAVKIINETVPVCSEHLRTYFGAVEA